MMTDRRASFRGMQALGIGVLATVAASINPGAPAAPSGDGVEIRVRVDRGEDLGQNFGSLFEARTRDGARPGFLQPLPADVVRTLPVSDVHPRDEERLNPRIIQPSAMRLTG